MRTAEKSHEGPASNPAFKADSLVMAVEMGDVSEMGAEALHQSSPDGQGLSHRLKKPRGFGQAMKNLLMVCIGSVVAIFVLGLLAGMGRGGSRKNMLAANRTEAINNARQIWVALCEFDEFFGRYPDVSTAAAVRARNSPPFSLGDGSSNELFRQLLAGTELKSEKPFCVRTGRMSKADDVMDDDTHALEAGECGFSYVIGLDAKSDPATPVVVAPLIPGTLTFDPSPFDGYAVVVFVGGSAERIRLDKAGHALDSHGMDLFDPSQPYWHGKPPVVKWPL